MLFSAPFMVAFQFSVTVLVLYRTRVVFRVGTRCVPHSNWKSNWELSAARALSVVHYFIDEHGVQPTRLSGTGYGEYHPVDENDTKEGRQKNRRVEIVVLPNVEKEQAQVEGENLK